MTNNSNTVIPEDVISQAVEWAGLLEGGLDADQQAQFEEWVSREELAAEALAQHYALMRLVEKRADTTSKVIALPKKPHVWSKYSKMGALIAAGLAIAVFFGTQFDSQKQVQSAIQLAAIEKRIDDFQLADESRIWLDRGAQADFEQTQTSRLVSLKTGRIFLDVAHDKSKPFIVNSEDVQFVVKGTSFEVDRQKRKVELSVQTGVVEIHFSDAIKTVRRGQKASFDLATYQLDLSTMDDAKMALWRQNKLYFDNIALHEVTQEFNRYFDVDIIIRDEDLAAEKISGVYEISTPEAFTQTLSELLDLDIVKNATGEIEISRRLPSDK
ncbi:FecR family protein [Hirschia litorea]|uniref:FecR family protein n=1 Tax=Hirschia litorea TaxID=1199156 RepID=A0ABW2IPH4_9PROT